MTTYENPILRLYYQGLSYVPKIDRYWLCHKYLFRGSYTEAALPTPPCSECWKLEEPLQVVENEVTVSEMTAVQATPVAEAEEVSTEQTMVAKANVVLDYLIDRAREYSTDQPGGTTWKDLLGALLTDKEATAGIRAAEKLNTGFYRVVPSGTGVAQYANGVTLAEAAACVAMLKENGRLIQCGRGRGKALIVTNNAHLPNDTPVVEVAEKPNASVATSSESSDDIEVIMANDVPNLLRAARDEYRSLRRSKEEAERNLRTANNRIQELEVQLEAKDAEIASWQRRSATQALTTWQ